VWVDLDRICTPVTSTRSKVKIKVTKLLKFQKLLFFRSISSAILVCSWKLMVDDGSMGFSLQLFGVWFLNFLVSVLSRDFKLYGMSILQDFQSAIFPYCLTLVTCLGLSVVLYVLCMLIWPWPDPRSRSWCDDCQPSSGLFLMILHLLSYVHWCCRLGDRTRGVWTVRNLRYLPESFSCERSALLAVCWRWMAHNVLMCR